MPNAAAAEWVLRLVTDPRRAAATVGDLLEDDRGAIRFWSSVLQTAASHIFHDIWDHPFALLRAGLAASLELGFVVAILIVVLSLIPRTADRSSLPVFLLTMGIAPGLALAVGWETARQSQGRELPAGLAQLALNAAFLVAAPRGLDSVHPVAPYISTLFYLLGVVLYRVRSVRRRKPFPLGLANATRHHR